MTLKHSIDDLGELMSLSPPRKSLHGKHLMISRFQETECPLTRMLEEAGADVSLLPLIQIRPISFVFPNLAPYDWIFFTSQQAVGLLGPSLATQQALGRLPKLGAVGAATAASLESLGLHVDFHPPNFHARAAAEAFVQAQPTAGFKVLWPCGRKANPTFAQILQSAGARVEPLVVYETLQILPDLQEPGMQALCHGEIDLLIFTSPSAVEAFAQLQKTLDATICNNASWEYASMGPSTSQAIHTRLGKSAVVEATPHTFQGLLESVCSYYQASWERSS